MSRQQMWQPTVYHRPLSSGCADAGYQELRQFHTHLSAQVPEQQVVIGAVCHQQKTPKPHLDMHNAANAATRIP
jgi:hypothetical protein